MIRRFNRYELKYLLHHADRLRVTRELTTLLPPDEHGKDGFYRVRSLYYDSPGLDFFWSKLDGIRFRRKLRVRIYPDPAGRAPGEAFVEIKQRVNRTVQKRRLRLPIEEAYRLCRARLETDDLEEMDKITASEVKYLVRSMHLQPRAIVSYQRQAFKGGTYEPGLRITFDIHATARIRGLDLRFDADDHYFLPPDRCIMEVKVNDRVPRWLVAFLARHQCRLARVSKYCSGLAVAGAIAVKEYHLLGEENRATG